MDKTNWKQKTELWKQRLRFLRLDEDLEDEEELSVEEEQIVQEENGEQSLKEKRAFRRRAGMYRSIFLAALFLTVIGSFVIYNRTHTFRDYIISETKAIEVAAGTKYLSLGKKLLRYNSDGVSCVSRKNETDWSLTYNMQAPIADVCDRTAVIAEQQGTQIYVVNEKGLLGSFETQLPILKVRVSRQGLVAVVLEEDAVTWINLYQADGTVVASDKTTIGDTGYPLDMDLSPNGQKLAVSYLGIHEGVMTGGVVFYHFGAAGKGKENNIVASMDYPETVIPEIYFTDNARAVAVCDNGFCVYQGTDAQKQSAVVEFEDEILSCFHDGETIGFLFQNSEGEEEYRMELYRCNGRKKASRAVDASFSEIRIEQGQILMYSDRELYVFSNSGRPRFASAYEKEVDGFFYFGEYRKYLVITPESFDKIRIS